MIQVDQKEFLKELEFLVNIDSGSRDPEGIRKVAAFFEEKFQELGWIVETHHIGDQVGPFLEIKNRKSDSYDVLMMGHMDTVFPLGTAAERPYREEGNRAYGPGVYDMKSGCLLAYYVCKEMEREGSLKNTSIQLAFNPDEEISSIYSRPVLEEMIKKSRYALVMEGGRPNGNLVNQRKGIGKYVVEFFGKAVHAGVEPENGASSIHEFLSRGQEILSWAKPEIGTTINIGTVKGGIGPNTVADYATCEIDIRVSTLAEGTRIVALFESLLEKVQIPGVTIKVTGGIRRPPLDPTEKSLQFCEQIDRIKEEIGLDIGWTSTGGGSDGNFSSALGVPTIDALGPVGGAGHQVAEYMDIDSIPTRSQLLYEIIKYCTSTR